MCRISTTWGPRLYFPSEGIHTQDFYALKKSIEPANLGSRGEYDNHWTTGVDRTASEFDFPCVIPFLKKVFYRILFWAVWSIKSSNMPRLWDCSNLLSLQNQFMNPTKFYAVYDTIKNMPIFVHFFIMLLYSISVTTIKLWQYLLYLKFYAIALLMRSLLNNSRLDGRGLSMCWNPDCQCRRLPKSRRLPFSGFLLLDVSSPAVGDIFRNGRFRCVRCSGSQRTVS